MENRQLNFEDKSQKYLKLPLRIVLDNVEDRMNVGMMFRLSDALGVEKVMICGTSPTPPNKMISRTARATDRHVPFQYFENVVDCIQHLQAEGFKVFALEITNLSEDISKIPFQNYPKVAILVGAEFDGVSAAALAAVDGSVHIPMHGMGFSMNVACSLAIGLYEVSLKMKQNLSNEN
ncbi:MAG: tRNA ((18)-2-O)-methyltransferase [Bacteroidota bacterium]|jgi:tRNA G18 (ribose-2'-O)-methylase SpoU